MLTIEFYSMFSTEHTIEYYSMFSTKHTIEFYSFPIEFYSITI